MTYGAVLVLTYFLIAAMAIPIAASLFVWLSYLPVFPLRSFEVYSYQTWDSRSYFLTWVLVLVVKVSFIKTVLHNSCARPLKLNLTASDYFLTVTDFTSGALPLLSDSCLETGAFFDFSSLFCNGPFPASVLTFLDWSSESLLLFNMTSVFIPRKNFQGDVKVTLVSASIVTYCFRRVIEITHAPHEPALANKKDGSILTRLI